MPESADNLIVNFIDFATPGELGNPPSCSPTPTISTFIGPVRRAGVVPDDNTPLIAGESRTNSFSSLTVLTQI